MHCSAVGLPVRCCLPEFAQTRVPEPLKPSSHLILCCPLPPSVFPCIKVFSNELALHIMWPKYWSFSFSTVLPVNIQNWFPLGLIRFLVSLQSKGFSRVFSSTRVQKHQFLSVQSINEVQFIFGRPVAQFQLFYRLFSHCLSTAILSPEGKYQMCAWFWRKYRI